MSAWLEMAGMRVNTSGWRGENPLRGDMRDV
jgi:hypothetical protein